MEKMENVGMRNEKAKMLPSQHSPFSILHFPRYGDD